MQEALSYSRRCAKDSYPGWGDKSYGRRFTVDPEELSATAGTVDPEELWEEADNGRCFCRGGLHNDMDEYCIH